MKGVFALAGVTLLLAALSAHALTPTPIDAQPYGPITADKVPAAAATCKAALDAAAKALTASNADFTTVAQPTGATAANNEYLYCTTLPDPTADQGTQTLTVFPDPMIQGKTLSKVLLMTDYPQVPSFMSTVAANAGQLTASGQYATTFYNWDLINHTKQGWQVPGTLKYDLLELIVVGANKYACGCAYKLSTVGSYGI